MFTLVALVSTSAAAQTQTVTACEGEIVTLEVPNVNSNRQWQVSTSLSGTYSNIVNENTLTYTFTASASDNGKYYRVRFTNPGGNKESFSNTFHLSVNPVPAAPSVINGSRSGRGSVTLHASGPPSAVSYRWYNSDGTAIDGATGASYTTPSLDVTTRYYVAAIGENGCESSSKTLVTATINPATGPIIAHDVTNASLVSNTDGVTAIAPLSANYPDASIAYYTLTTLPDAAQGKLFLHTVPVVPNQTITTTEAKSLLFAPEETFFGTASFSYTVTHTNGESSTAAIYRIPVNAAPVSSNVSSGNIARGNIRIEIPKLISSDPDGVVQHYIILSVPSPGSLWTSATGGTAVTAGQTVISDQLYFNPGGNGNGTPVRSFTYAAVDDKNVLSNTSTYTLYINADPPPTAENITTGPIVNTAGITAITPLSATGGTITGYRILSTSLPKVTQGTLYTGTTAITALPQSNGYYLLSPAQASNLQFRPNKLFYGIITFYYSATNASNTEYSLDAYYKIQVTNVEPLPVTLIDLKAHVTKQGVRLTWSTATEENNDRFVVERSQDGKTFAAIGEVKGSGNSRVTRNYSFTDVGAPAGTSYYRLKQVDFDGRHEYSKLVEVTVEGNTKAILTAYPNPFSSNLNILLPMLQEGKVYFQLYDTKGSLSYSHETVLGKGLQEVALPLQGFSNGVYFLKLAAGETSYTLKVIKTL
ncbi:T9SS type A sorting domain-containing protein [uncultured Pontibacter sp.]|uniref:Ig-like domain-containing protein n=1 Tax=uncultured Pontibacter sp. TaxID=453356 RepID=UPI002602B79B|nr:T9SS type A sorting domain-containing protein [uncultured Pontibacter sp.]